MIAMVDVHAMVQHLGDIVLSNESIKWRRIKPPPN
jgi:hypothetical protein